MSIYLDYFANMSINVGSNSYSNRKHEFGYENWIWSFGIINPEKDGNHPNLCELWDHLFEK